MSHCIEVLPSAVADQIAAGEVVERPASVVKELVENALDAGASAVEIAITDGGRGAVRVSDDGAGMGPEDARLALERYATSKIRSAADLVGVRSFGFRGEALPAICSVSRLELETSPADGAGTRVRAAAGAVTEVGTISRRRGTTVTVSQLFFNVPARQKFLRGARSEWRAITDVVTLVALTRRDVRIVLTHDGKAMLTLPPTPSLRARVAALYGGPYADGLLDVEHVGGTTHVSGLVERPSDAGTVTRRIHLTLNGRAIRDPGMIRAAELAYRSTIPVGVRPSLFLDIVAAADGVDVNVHPAKSEVRLRDRWPIERAVETAVRRALGTFDSGATLSRSAWPAARPWIPEGEVDVEVLQRPVTGGDGTFLGADASSEWPDDSSPAGERGAVLDASTTLPAEPPPLTQLRRTYMMFEHDEGVVLIDQHSAHERVLYERFMRIFECGDAPSQRLLFPMTIHLDPREAEAYEANAEAFAQLGYEVEGFGGQTLLVRATPMPHARFDAERCLRDTLTALTGDRAGTAHARHERLAATVACKAAVKAGDALSSAEMRALFLALSATALPAHDVHGRSTIVRLAWNELERRFGRR